MNTQLTINFKGGIVSPGDLLSILKTASSMGTKNIRLGLRQQLILEVPVQKAEAFCNACAQHNIAVQKGKNQQPNIMSSYATAGIMAEETWLTEGVYKDVFDSFTEIPSLKINICDSTQCFVPLFSGHINWIPSSNIHYWFLYIRFPESHSVFCWPELIYTNDIASVSEKLDSLLQNEPDSYYSNGIFHGKKLYSFLKSNFSYTGKPVETELVLPKFYLPYYEGFNKIDHNYWLGIYRRDELFPVSFLIDICNTCLETKIGQIYTTPWKSLIIKGIEQQNRNIWNYILGKYRINVRHAANELNWQVEDSSEEGLIIKRHIIRHFDKEDVRTYGLSFAVETQPTSSLFGSVIIRKQQNKNQGRLKSAERFDIVYNPHFNPNSADRILFRTAVEKDHIGTYLVSLCKLFYEQENKIPEIKLPVTTQPYLNTNAEKTSRLVYQCSHCLTVYDELAGDTENNIEAGTLFKDIPAAYLCPLCNADKTDFKAVEENSLLLHA